VAIGHQQIGQVLIWFVSFIVSTQINSDWNAWP